MKNKILLHPTTNLQLENIIKNPPHAILISAPDGGGKKYLSYYISVQLLNLENVKHLEKYPYFFHISRQKNKSEITIEQIRNIIDALKLKTPGQNKVRRIIYIEDAHFLSNPAQNALLKILEEPSVETVFILSTKSKQYVLPTIASRTQILDLQPSPMNDSINYWSAEGFSKQQIESAWKLSGGSNGLMYALLNKDTEHPLKQAVDEAKIFIKSSKYQRLLQADNLSKNKENFDMFLDALSRTLSFLHHSLIKLENEKQAQKLLNCRKLVKKSAMALENNVNSRIVALNLVLKFNI